MTVVFLRCFFFTSDLNVLGVDNNYVITCVYVWGKFRFVFTSKSRGNACSQTPQRVLRCVYNKPIVHSILCTYTLSFQEIVKLGRNSRVNFKRNYHRFDSSKTIAKDHLLSELTRKILNARRYLTFDYQALARCRRSHERR